MTIHTIFGENNLSQTEYNSDSTHSSNYLHGVFICSGPATARTLCMLPHYTVGERSGGWFHNRSPFLPRRRGVLRGHRRCSSSCLLTPLTAKCPHHSSRRGRNNPGKKMKGCNRCYDEYLITKSVRVQSQTNALSLRESLCTSTAIVLSGKVSLNRAWALDVPRLFHACSSTSIRRPD